MPSSRARSSSGHRDDEVVVEAGVPGRVRRGRGSGRRTRPAAPARCRSARASCSLASPSDTVHSSGIRSLTSRQPRVVDTAVTLPAGNAREGLGSTHGARVIDSTPPATTTSASPVSTSGRPVIAASSEEPHSRLTVVAGTDTGRPASSTAIRPTLRLSSPAWLAQPQTTSPIRPGRARAPWPARPERAIAARSSGRTSAKRAAEPAERGPHGGVHVWLGHWSCLLAAPAGRSGTRCSRRVPHSRSRSAAGTSLISSTVRPLRRAARRCRASSSWWPRATSAVSVIIERLRRSRPGRVQIAAPGVLGDEVLELAGQIGGAVDRAVDVVVAEHLAPDGHPVVVPAHRAPSPACSRDQAGHVVGSPRPGLGARHRRAPRSRPSRTPSAICAQARWRGGTSYVPRHGEHRRGDLGQPVADVEGRQRAAERGVRRVVGLGESVQQAPSRLGVRVRGSPGPNQRCAAGAHLAERAGRPDLRDPLTPSLRGRRSWLRCRAGWPSGPGRARRAAAADRPPRRRSRRRSGRSPRGRISTRASTPAARSAIEKVVVGHRMVRAVPGQVPGETSKRSSSAARHGPHRVAAVVPSEVRAPAAGFMPVTRFARVSTASTDPGAGDTAGIPACGAWARASSAIVACSASRACSCSSGCPPSGRAWTRSPSSRSPRGARSRPCASPGSRRAGPLGVPGAVGAFVAASAAARCSVAASCGAVSAARRMSTEATGFCLCGMVDEPPPPASSSSPISGAAQGQDVVGDLAPGVGAADQRVADPGDRRAVGVPGQRGSSPSA